METRRFANIGALASSAAGLLLLVAGVLMAPEFVETHFGSGGTLPDTTRQAIQVLRVIAVLTGVVAVFLTVNLRYPSRVNSLFDRLSRLLSSLVGKRLQTRRFYLPFCFLCLALALTAGLLATQSGVGLYYDSINYITAGENLFNGDGFGSLAGETFAHFPLYPLLIAGFMLFGLDAEQAARLIPILSFALLVFPVFYIGKAIGGIRTGYVACLICLVLTPMLWLATWALPDMTCILFSALATLFLVKFSQTPQPDSRTLFVAGLFTGLAIATRFSAVTLIPVGLLAIVVRGNWGTFQVSNNSLALAIGAKQPCRKTLQWVLLFLAPCILLIVSWLVRNLVATGWFSAGFTSGPLEGSISLIKWIVVDSTSDLLTGWFTSGLNEVSRLLVFDLRVFDIRGYLSVAIVLVGLILLGVHLSRRKAPGHSLWAWVKTNYLVIAQILSYYCMLVATGLTWFMLLQRNYLAAAYPFIILLTVSFVLYAFTGSKRGPLRPTFALVIVLLFASVFGLQVGESVSYYKLAKDGQGNISAQWVSEQGLAWIADNTPQDALVYSDAAEMISYRSGRDALHLPHTEWREELSRLFENLGNVENTFIIVFKDRFHRWYKPSVSEIAELNQEYGILEIVAEFPTSTIWRVLH